MQPGKLCFAVEAGKRGRLAPAAPPRQRNCPETCVAKAPPSARAEDAFASASARKDARGLGETGVERGSLAVKGGPMLLLPRMSTLAEIEAAADALPPRQQRKLLEHLAARLAEVTMAPLSAHDLMKDGCGIVRSGKRDLSTNKKHLSGYGK